MGTAGAVLYGIGLLLSALRAGPEIMARWRIARDILREGREPTDAEWAALDQAIADNATERDNILAGKQPS